MTEALTRDKYAADLRLVTVVSERIEQAFDAIDAAVEDPGRLVVLCLGVSWTFPSRFTMQCMKEAATGLPSESPLDVFVCDQDFCEDFCADLGILPGSSAVIVYHLGRIVPFHVHVTRTDLTAEPQEAIISTQVHAVLKSPLNALQAEHLLTRLRQLLATSNAQQLLQIDVDW